MSLAQRFSLDGRVAVVTGATGAIGSAVTRGLAEAGARVALVARTREALESAAGSLAASGAEALACRADVLDPESLEQARGRVLERWHGIDVLVTCAGGNVAAATLPPDGALFSVPVEAVREVLELNVLGTLLPARVFGEPMVTAGDGRDRSIVTISSMAATRALTRVGGYGAAKAAVESLTRWLAVEAALRDTGVRVNAIAPGFFLGEQNRRLLLREDGTPTERGAAVLDGTPAGRFGEPDELVSTVVWLCAPGSAFVTGTVVPVDGGFGAWAGV